MHASFVVLAVVTPTICQATIVVDTNEIRFNVGSSLFFSNAGGGTGGISRSFARQQFMPELELTRMQVRNGITASGFASYNTSYFNETDSVRINDRASVHSATYWDDIEQAHADDFESATGNARIRSTFAFSTNEDVLAEIELGASTSNASEFVFEFVRNGEEPETLLTYGDDKLPIFVQHDIFLAPGSYTLYYELNAGIALNELSSLDGAEFLRGNVFLNASVTTIPAPAAALLFPISAVYCSRRRR